MQDSVRSHEKPWSFLISQQLHIELPEMIIEILIENHMRYGFRKSLQFPTIPYHPL